MKIEKLAKNDKVTLEKWWEILYNEAINLAIAENGDVSGWETEDVEDNRFVLSGEADEPMIRNFFKINVITNKLKLSKDCGYDKDGCFADNVKQLNGISERDFNKIKSYYNVILSNGMSVSIEPYVDSTLLLGKFWVDVNGSKQPNVVGRDIFLFMFEGAKVKGYGDYKNCKINGYSCADWILSNGNMDYLKK